jgi:hypothetical protein
MLTDAGGQDVALIPATTIEDMYEKQQRGDFWMAAGDL